MVIPANQGKTRIPRERREEHKQLLDAWDDGRPTERISREPYWKALGLEWGMLILCGITHYRVGDVIYFKTDARPSPDSGAIEIVESEFKAAEKHWAHNRGDYGWISLCIRLRSSGYG